MNNAIIYDVDYFIKKFEAIPEENWYTGRLCNRDNTRRCALGHCCPEYMKPYFNNGEGQTDESKSLEMLFCSHHNISVGNINDGRHTITYQQPTPKLRILAALYDIKRMQQPVHENISSEIAQWKIVEEREDVVTTKEKIQL